MGDISREADEQFAGEGYDRDASSDGRATRHRNVDVVFRFAHDSPLEGAVRCELVSAAGVRLRPLRILRVYKKEGRNPAMPCHLSLVIKINFTWL